MKRGFGKAPLASAAEVDYAALYDAHPEYIARRASGSIEQAQVDIEVRLFKLPNLLALLALLPPVGIARPLASVLEIGCATGELIGSVPVEPGGRRVGIDISAQNIAAARERFSAVEYHCGDFRELACERFDAVIISDVLEHVPDDCTFLRDASRLGRLVLVNLPLEDNWLNRSRRYGPDDASGHLRRYSLADGLGLFERAGLDVVARSRVWVHETPTDAARRALRQQRLGAAYSGSAALRLAKRAVYAAAGALPPFGRRLFASNLFAAARPRR